MVFLLYLLLIYYLHGHFFLQQMLWSLNVHWRSAILFPILFSLQVKLSRDIICGFGIRCYQYADDTQLQTSLTKSSGDAVEVLRYHLIALVKWLKANKMKLNPDETEVMLAGKVDSWRTLCFPLLMGFGWPLPKGYTGSRDVAGEAS